MGEIVFEEDIILEIPAVLIDVNNYRRLLRGRKVFFKIPKKNIPFQIKLTPNLSVSPLFATYSSVVYDDDFEIKYTINLVLRSGNVDGQGMTRSGVTDFETGIFLTIDIDTQHQTGTGSNTQSLLKAMYKSVTLKYTGDVNYNIFDVAQPTIENAVVETVFTNKTDTDDTFHNLSDLFSRFETSRGIVQGGAGSTNSNGIYLYGTPATPDFIAKYEGNVWIGEIFYQLNGRTSTTITQEVVSFAQYDYSLPAKVFNDWHDEQLVFDWYNGGFLNVGNPLPGGSSTERIQPRDIMPFWTRNHSVSRTLLNWGTYVVVDDVWDLTTWLSSVPNQVPSGWTMTKHIGSIQATNNAPTKTPSQSLARSYMNFAELKSDTSGTNYTYGVDGNTTSSMRDPWYAFPADGDYVDMPLLSMQGSYIGRGHAAFHYETDAPYNIDATKYAIQHIAVSSAGGNPYIVNLGWNFQQRVSAATYNKTTGLVTIAGQMDNYNVAGGLGNLQAGAWVNGTVQMNKAPHGMSETQMLATYEGIQMQLIDTPTWLSGSAVRTNLSTPSFIDDVTNSDWVDEISDPATLTRTATYVNSRGDKLEVSTVQTFDSGEAISTNTVHMNQAAAMANRQFSLVPMRMEGKKPFVFPDIEQGVEYEIPIDFIIGNDYFKIQNIISGGQVPAKINLKFLPGMP